MTRMASYKDVFTAEDVAKAPRPPEWASKLTCLPMPRVLRISMPCLGINNGGRAMDDCKWKYKHTNSCDILTTLAPVLSALHAGLDGIKLGPEEGDLLSRKIETLEPCDALIAGPPCPPWAGNGKHKPGDQP